jgi:two-component system NarL family sensor kinase
MDHKTGLSTPSHLNFDSALKASLIEQVLERFGNDGYLGRTSSQELPASVNVTKYEAALNALACELARAKEKERERMAERLHDEFGQDLLVAKMRLGQLFNTLPRRYGGSLKGIADIITDLIRHTRSAMEELSSQTLCERGLKSALQSLAKDLKAKHGINCLAELDAVPDLMKEETGRVLFRAARELLFNVVKHAGASQVKILAVRKAGSVVIEVSDNGRGFDRHKMPLSDLSIGRFGLFSVRADLASIGADLRIFSRLGKGTRATITLSPDAA